MLALVLVLSVGFYATGPSAEATKKVSYLMDKKKVYSYYRYDAGESNYEEKVKFKKVTSYGFNEWVNKYDAPCFAYKETKKGLYDGFVLNVLKYPIKKGNKWKDIEGNSYKIVSDKKTIKTKAGTFKNVVEVKRNFKGQKRYYVDYYAPNIGLILSKSNEGKAKSKTEKIQELSKLKSI